jgi:hypothetical protein
MSSLIPSNLFPLSAPLQSYAYNLPVENQCPNIRSFLPFTATNADVEHQEYPVSFESSVKDLVEGKNLYIKRATSGMSGAPILFDAVTDEALAIFKEDGRWLTASNHGDELAYRLDHDSYAKVPRAFRITSLAENATQGKRFLSGAFVEWVPNRTESSILQLPSANLEDRQAVAILDMRLGNCDRHNVNLLINENGEITPIDHDNAFSKFDRPSLSLATSCYALTPLTDKASEYIRNLDINRDVAIMREYEMPESEIQNLVIRTTFLKIAADMGAEITVSEIEQIIEFINLPSGRIDTFFENWIAHHPLVNILNTVSEPFDEDELKETFKMSFNYYHSLTRDPIQTLSLTNSKVLLKMFMKAISHLVC